MVQAPCATLTRKVLVTLETLSVLPQQHLQPRLSPRQRQRRLQQQRRCHHQLLQRKSQVVLTGVSLTAPHLHLLLLLHPWKWTRWQHSTQPCRMWWMLRCQLLERAKPHQLRTMTMTRSLTLLETSGASLRLLVAVV